MKTLSIFSAIAILLGRFFIAPRLDLPTAEGSYEAFAHLFVGGCFGWAAAKRQWRWASVGIALSLFELAMFIIQKSNQ